MTQKTLMWQLENEREDSKQATAEMRLGKEGAGIIRALILIALIYALGFGAVWVERTWR
jgi:uncharacterized protein HemX